MIKWDEKTIILHSSDLEYRVMGFVGAVDAEPTEWYAEIRQEYHTHDDEPYASIEHNEQGFGKMYHKMEEAIKVCEDHVELHSTTEDGEAFFDIEDEP